MKLFRKIAALLLSVMIFAPALSGCDFGGGYYLTVYNWADYIDESVLDDFTEYYQENVDKSFKGVIYQTCDTPETMFTKLYKSGDPWDVACNSDYLEGKLLRLGQLQPFPVDEKDEDGGPVMPNYNKYIPEYMREQYKSIQDVAIKGYENSGNNVPLDANGEVVGTYGIGYMWGTMGIVFNVDAVNKAGGQDEVYKNWNLMWNPSFDGGVYMKNSVRESYIVGLLQAYTPELEAELKKVKNAQASGDLAAVEAAKENYRSYLSKLLGTVADGTGDKTDPFYNTIPRVQSELIRQQSAVHVKYDVDYDKIAMATGQAMLDYCWAGDGYKAITMGAEEPNPVVLSYDVPDTGTNLFFDGWFMNGKLDKTSAKYKASVAFVDYLCAPEQAQKDMTEIGYVSATAGIEMLEWGAENWKLATMGGTDEKGKPIKPVVLDPDLKKQGDNLDLSYFFGDAVQEYIDKHGEYPKINPVQYPDAKEMYRFAIVKTYENAETDKLLEMWSKVKTGDFPLLQIIFFSIFAAIMIGLSAFKLIQKNKNKKSAVKVKSKRNYERIR